MPKLVLFVACEKLILDAQSSNPSIIALLDNINVAMPEGLSVPPTANSPIRWDILALWLREPGDEGQVYEQRTYLIQPNGELTVDGTAKFEMLGQRQNVIANVTGFPVGRAGDATLVLLLRKADADEEWEEMARYPMQIVHQSQPVTPILPSLDKV